MKINNDFTGDSAANKSAIKFLHDCFGDSIDDYNFIRWLSKKMNYKPKRLFNLLKNCEKLPAYSRENISVLASSRNVSSVNRSP